MNKLKQGKLPLALVLALFLVFSCQKSEKWAMLPDQEQGLNVSIELATTVAQNFSCDQAFLHHPGADLKKSSYRSSKFKPDKKVKEVLTVNGDDNLPAIYIVKFDPEGFVIVPGCKKESPILAYSETGDFIYAPSIYASSGLNEWIEMRKERIKYLRGNPSVKTPDEIAELWVCAAPPEDEEVTISGGTVYEQKGPLMATSWDQGVGYNNNAPYLGCASPSNGRAWTGCVATATAQVMKFWKRPGSYNWAAMPNYSGSAETSRLMRDIGDKVGMVYGCGGSAATVSKARDALILYFGYSKSAVYVNSNSSTIVAQLNYGWPVIMCGSEPGGSDRHAWVCDGYRRNRHIVVHNPGTVYEYETSIISNFYLWMNWGLGHLGNAWYLYNDLTPDIYNYNSNKYMIINIHP